MGIGAYQAREYIRKLGGNIDVTSEPGLGSCFSVRVPLADANQGKAPEQTERLVSDNLERAQSAN